MASLGYAEIPDGALAGQYLYALPGKLPLARILPRWRSRRGHRGSQPPEHSDVGYELSGAGKRALHAAFHARR